MSGLHARRSPPGLRMQTFADILFVLQSPDKASEWRARCVACRGLGGFSKDCNPCSGQSTLQSGCCCNRSRSSGSVQTTPKFTQNHSHGHRGIRIVVSFVILVVLQLPDIRGQKPRSKFGQIEREAPSDNAMVILGLTGNVEEENLHEYAKAGMNGCIMKGKLLGEALNEAMAKLEYEPQNFVTAIGDDGRGRRKDSPKSKWTSAKSLNCLSPKRHPLCQMIWTLMLICTHRSRPASARPIKEHCFGCARYCSCD